MLAGREFTLADALGAPKVAIVNEAFAKKFNLGRDAVGKHMRPTSGRRQLDIGDRRARAEREVQRREGRDSAAVLPSVSRRTTRSRGDHFYVRTAADPDAVPAEHSRRSIARLDPNLPVENLRTLPQQMRENVFLDRFISVAVRGVCAARDAARRRRALRRAGLHGHAAHARDRPAHGARRAPARVRGWCCGRSA